MNSTLVSPYVLPKTPDLTIENKSDRTYPYMENPIDYIVNPYLTLNERAAISDSGKPIERPNQRIINKNQIEVIDENVPDMPPQKPVYAGRLGKSQHMLVNRYPEAAMRTPSFGHIDGNKYDSDSDNIYNPRFNGNKSKYMKLSKGGSYQSIFGIDRHVLKVTETANLILFISVGVFAVIALDKVVGYCTSNINRNLSPLSLTPKKADITELLQNISKEDIVKLLAQNAN